MESKTFSVGLMIACIVGACLCQQQQQTSSFLQSGSSVGQQQTKLEDIERDSLATAFGHKTVAAPVQQQQQQQQQSGKSLSSASSPQQQAYLQQTNAAVVPQQQQYYVQPSPYQAVQQPQLFVYPSQQQQYLGQPFQMAFDYAGVPYMIINPNAYNQVANNQLYQPYYVPAAASAATAAAQPSAVPQYVSKPSAPSAAAPTTPAPQVEYKQQQFAVPVPQVPQQAFKYVVPNATPAAYQYVQQPAGGTVDFSYVTRHSVPSAQFKAPAAAVQSHYVQQLPQQQQYQQQQQPQQQQQQQYHQQQQQQQQPQQYQSQLSQQFYYTIPAGQPNSAEPQQPRVQQSIKSQFSSGIKSTTASPYKEPFAYKFESSPVQQQSQSQPQQQQQQPGSAYSTLRFSV